LKVWPICTPISASSATEGARDEPRLSGMIGSHASLHPRADASAVANLIERMRHDRGSTRDTAGNLASP